MEQDKEESKSSSIILPQELILSILDLATDNDQKEKEYMIFKCQDDYFFLKLSPTKVSPGKSSCSLNPHGVETHEKYKPSLNLNSLTIVQEPIDIFSTMLVRSQKPLRS